MRFPASSDWMSLPALVVAALVTGPVHAAPPAAFAVCSGCHQTTPDGRSVIGPNLSGVAGRRAGTLAGFNYSQAMRRSRIVWTKAELLRFIQNPSRTVPGTSMPYAGEPDPVVAAQIASYLVSRRITPPKTGEKRR